jgi:elongation factor Tu
MQFAVKPPPRWRGWRIGDESDVDRDVPELPPDSQGQLDLISTRTYHSFLVNGDKLTSVRLEQSGKQAQESPILSLRFRQRRRSGIGWRQRHDKVIHREISGCSGIAGNGFVCDCSRWEAVTTTPRDRDALLERRDPGGAHMARTKLNVAFLGGEVIGRGSLTAALTRALEAHALGRAGRDVDTALARRWLNPVPYHFTFETPEHACVGIDYGHFAAPAVHLPGSADLINAAVLMVSAPESVRAQTREQALLARECGVRHLLLFVDTAAGPESDRIDVAEAETRATLAELGYPADDLPSIRGEAAGALDELLETLDAFVPRPHRDAEAPFLLAIDDVPEPRNAVGWVQRGRVRVGDEVEVLGVEFVEGTLRVAALEGLDGPVEEASAGDRVRVRLGAQQIGGRPAPMLRQSGRTSVLLYRPPVPLLVGQVLAALDSARTATQFEAECFVPTRAEGGSDQFLVPGVGTLFRIRGREVYGTFLIRGGHVAMPGDRVRIEVDLNGNIVLEPGLRFTVTGPGDEPDLGDLPEGFAVVTRLFG